MKGIKSLITAISLLVCIGAYAQKPGYQAYKTVAFVNDGVRTEAQASSTVFVKFEGDLLYLDMSLPFESRYIFSGRQSDGNLLYYQQAYNHGTMMQGSGWVTQRNSYIIITPDHKHFNMSPTGGRSVTIYTLQTADSAGSMIY